MFIAFYSISSLIIWSSNSAKNLWVDFYSENLRESYLYFSMGKVPRKTMKSMRGRGFLIDKKVLQAEECWWSGQKIEPNLSLSDPYQYCFYLLHRLSFLFTPQQPLSPQLTSRLLWSFLPPLLFQLKFSLSLGLPQPSKLQLLSPLFFQ